MSEKTKKIIKIMAPISLIALVGISYAIFYVILAGNKEHILKTGNLEFSYEEPSNSLQINDTKVMSDEDGIAQTDYFEFKVSAEDSEEETMNYRIYLVENANSTMANTNVKVNLTQVVNSSETQVLAPTIINNLSSYAKYEGAKILYDSSFTFDGISSLEQIHIYRFRIWFNNGTITETTNGDSQNISMSSSTYSYKINVTTIIE